MLSLLLTNIRIAERQVNHLPVIDTIEAPLRVFVHSVDRNPRKRDSFTSYDPTILKQQTIYIILRNLGLCNDIVDVLWTKAANNSVNQVNVQLSYQKQKPIDVYCEYEIVSSKRYSNILE